MGLPLGWVWMTEYIVDSMFMVRRPYAGPEQSRWAWAKACSSRKCTHEKSGGFIFSNEITIKS